MFHVLPNEELLRNVNPKFSLLSICIIKHQSYGGTCPSISKFSVYNYVKAQGVVEYFQKNLVQSYI